VRYLELIFVLVFVFIGLINVIIRIAASKRRKQKEAGSARVLPEKKKTVEADDHHPPISKKRAAVWSPPGISSEQSAASPGISSEQSAVSPGISPGQRPEPSSIYTLKPPVREPEKEPEEEPVKESEKDLSAGRIPGRSDKYVKSADASTPGSGQLRTVEMRYQESAWDIINRLPPLKKAVVMSEILGPPKGQ
jgi:hypothetical protein